MLTDLLTSDIRLTYETIAAVRLISHNVRTNAASSNNIVNLLFFDHLPFLVFMRPLGIKLLRLVKGDGFV